MSYLHDNILSDNELFWCLHFSKEQQLDVIILVNVRMSETKKDVIIMPGDEVALMIVFVI